MPDKSKKRQARTQGPAWIYAIAALVAAVGTAARALGFGL